MIYQLRQKSAVIVYDDEDEKESADIEVGCE